MISHRSAVIFHKIKQYDQKYVEYSDSEDGVPQPSTIDSVLKIKKFFFYKKSQNATIADARFSDTDTDNYLLTATRLLNAGTAAMVNNVK